MKLENSRPHGLLTLSLAAIRVGATGHDLTGTGLAPRGREV